MIIAMTCLFDTFKWLGLALRVRGLATSNKPTYHYLEVHGTYNLLSNCSYNLNISPITTVTLDIIGL